MANHPAHCERRDGIPSQPPSAPRLRELTERKVLYVEDDEDSREALKMFLELHGCKVVGTASATAGLEALRTQRFDLVISDYNLPDQDGGSMLDEAAEDGLLDCEAIIVTGSCQVRDAKRPVLVKPIDPRAILAMVEGLPDRSDD